jgi:DNA-binding response OmpR family regulator
MKKRILLIDDDRELCEEVAEILEDVNYDVEKVYVGTEGQILAQQYNYDVILLDLKIPGDGFKILEKLKNEKPERRILVVTANPIAKEEKEYIPICEEHEKAQILKLADGVINKPFDIEYLITRIGELIY